VDAAVERHFRTREGLSAQEGQQEQQQQEHQQEQEQEQGREASGEEELLFGFLPYGAEHPHSYVTNLDGVMGRRLFMAEVFERLQAEHMVSRIRKYESG
jgi:hypothetical protein